MNSKTGNRILFSSSTRAAKKQQRCDTVSLTCNAERSVFNFISTSEIYDFFARQFFKKLLPSKWHPFWTCHLNLFPHSWTRMVKSFCKSRFFSKFHPSPRNSFEICQDSICFSRADGSIGKRPQKVGILGAHNTLVGTINTLHQVF